MLRALNNDHGVSSLIQLARGLARSMTSFQSVCATEIQHRCWWTLNRLQSRCAEESQTSATGSAQWDDYARPLNLNDYDLDPTLQAEPHARPGITDTTLLIVRLQFVRLIESVNQALSASPPSQAVAQCRAILTEKSQMLHREYLQYAHESRPHDQFLSLTYEVLKVCSGTVPTRVSLLIIEGQDQHDDPSARDHQFSKRLVCRCSQRRHGRFSPNRTGM